MTAETLQNTTKTFKFSFPTCTNEEVLFKLEVPVEIPHGGSTRELVQRVINMFHIPVYLEDELNEKLAEFVAGETKNFHNDRDEKLLNQLKNNEVNVEGIVKHWEKLFKENVVEYAEQTGTSDEEVFAGAYHKLVHSPALPAILRAERDNARALARTLRGRREDVARLTQRQTEEMEECVRLLNTRTSEAEINALAAAHFEQQGLAAARWGSQLDAQRRAQRAAHRTALMAALDRAHAGAGDDPLQFSNFPLASPSPEPDPEPAPREEAAPRPRLEESFTIHLGSQLKQTHNIRIINMDLLDLCTGDDLDSPTEASRRLQTSLALYSGELSAAVLLCESPPPLLAPPTARLVAAASASTEYHFPDVDAQLRDIVERVEEPVEARNGRRAREQAGAGGAGGASAGSRRRRSLQTGDVFVTRHSNLPDVHVVFHLVVDDSSLRSGDITSRHPAILGLRNILKAACCNDVTTISLPLLLRHEHSEEMTAAWCLRRAELVLKCVKGFVLETAGGGGAELRTLHAALPPDTHAQAFLALARLLPAIFRVSNPVKFKPQPPPDDEAADAPGGSA